MNATELPREIKVKTGTLIPMHSGRLQVFQLGWCEPGRDKGEAEGVGQLKGFTHMVCSLWLGTRPHFALNLTLPSEYRARSKGERKEKACQEAFEIHRPELEMQQERLGLDTKDF